MLRNKQLARKDITEIVFNMLESDDEHEEMIHAGETKHHQLAVMDNQLRVEEENRHFCKDVCIKTAKKKILSCYDQYTYVMIPSGSVCFFVGNIHSKMGQGIEAHSLCYITHTGPNMPVIRKIFGNIAVTFPKDVPNIKRSLTHLLVTSLTATTQHHHYYGGPPRHLLMKVGH